MRRIGISQNIIISKNGYTFKLDKNWFDYISKFNANLIPLGFDKFNIKKIDNLKLDGIIISGGGDIYSLKKKKSNLIRDEFEYKLICYFKKKNKPILTICRGFQLIAAKLKNEIIKVNNHVKTHHKVKIYNNRYFKNLSSLNTNSYHNFGISSLNKHFEVLGKSKDKSIEFAKIKNKKIYCIMFHPERYNIDQKKIDIMIKKIFSF